MGKERSVNQMQPARDAPQPDIGATVAGLLTYDFCPGANRWVSWAKRPIFTLLIALTIALVCALFVSPVAVISCAAIVVVISLGYGWPHITIRGLSARLRFAEHRIIAGETAHAIVTVQNAWPWPVWGVTAEIDLGGDSPATVALARIGGWSTEEFAWECAPKCRGVYPRHSPRLTTSFPFGLAVAGRDLAAAGTLLAWPRTIELDTLADAAETRPTEERFSETRIGDSGDMLGTRPFRNGDSLRRVHWACTARFGTMIVCERQAAALAAVRVVFDSDPTVHSGTGPTSTLEQSIRLAASVCLAYQRANALVECCYGHESIRVAAGGAGLTRFLDTLATFRSCDHDHRDCQHTHRAAACRRIHHGNCGVFQVTITTRRGLRLRTEHRHVHGDQLWLVIDDGETPAAAHLPAGRIVDVGSATTPLASFRRAWRQLCHAG
jgi:uncharacterized protein (DUF58 family)